MHRELTVYGRKREDVSPFKAVLFGAAAGYAVNVTFIFYLSHFSLPRSTFHYYYSVLSFTKQN